MRITLTLSVIDRIIEKANFLNRHLNWSIRDAIKDKQYSETDSVFVDLSEIEKVNCEILSQLLTIEKYNSKTISTLNNWIKNLSNPKNAVVTSLPMLEKTLISLFKADKNKWVLKMNPDGMIVPCAVTGIKYRGRTKDNDATVVLSLSYISMESADRWGSEETTIKKSKQDKNVYFYKENISDISEDEFNDFSVSNDDYDEDSEEKKPKSKSKSKKDGFLLSKILLGKEIMLMDESYVESYLKDVEKANQTSKKIGSVFTCEGRGYIVSDNGGKYYNWKDLNDDNKKNKLVIDEIKQSLISYTTQSDGLGTIEIPEHPYLLTYDITSFRYAIVHVNNVEPYKYNEDILSKLVLTDKRKNILSSLIGSKNNFEDIVSGKSGGIVILSTGESGLGKTLTAEVYSEVMKKPLYCVQSSQLGISVSEIEKNLNRILYRAEKWDAVLLIDEADSYIYKRGRDILQN